MFKSSISQVKLPDKQIIKNQPCFTSSFYCGLCPLIGLSPLPSGAGLLTRPPPLAHHGTETISWSPRWNIPGFLSCILLCLSPAQMLTSHKSNTLGVLGNRFPHKTLFIQSLSDIGLRSEGQELAITPGGQKATECDMEVAARGFWEIMATCLPSFLTILMRAVVPSASRPRGEGVQRKG